MHSIRFDEENVVVLETQNDSMWLNLEWKLLQSPEFRLHPKSEVHLSRRQLWILIRSVDFQLLGLKHWNSLYHD